MPRASLERPATSWGDFGCCDDYELAPLAILASDVAEVTTAASPNISVTSVPDVVITVIARSSKAFRRSRSFWS